MGLITKHLCNAHCMYIWHTCTNALDDPKRPSGAPGYGIWPVLALTWYNQIFKIIFLSLYLIILGLLDNTSQRKLAHIQRLILLNFYFNSITDITVSTFPLAICDRSVLLVSNLFYFIFIFFQTQLLAYNLEKYLLLVLAPRFTTRQLTHGCEWQFLAYWTALQWSPSLTKSMFSHLFRQITRIIGTIYHKYSIFYQQREYPKYSQYSKQFSPI